MAKKARFFRVTIRTAHQPNGFGVGYPVPAADKYKLISELTSEAQAVVNCDFLGWYDVEIYPGDYFEIYDKVAFQMKIAGNEFIYSSNMYGYAYLIEQFRKQVDEIIYRDY